jgi:uncharacterized protein
LTNCKINNIINPILLVPYGDLMAKKSRKTALITGATSGIGAAYARYFASQGYDLILTGRRKNLLMKFCWELAAECHINARPIIADISKLDEIARIVEMIRKEKDLEVLVNNAGFGNKRPFGEGGLEEQTDMVIVHDLAPVRFVHAALPQMLKNKNGTIINVASMAAFMPSPADSMYCSTKAFLVTFSESLFVRLKRKGIRVQVLCPGYTRTDFHEKLGIQASQLKDKGIVKWMTPDFVVRNSIRTLGGNNPICIPGFWYKVIFMLTRIVPRGLFYRLAAGGRKRK